MVKIKTADEGMFTFADVTTIPAQSYNQLVIYKSYAATIPSVFRRSCEKRQTGLGFHRSCHD